MIGVQLSIFDGHVSNADTSDLLLTSRRPVLCQGTHVARNASEKDRLLGDIRAVRETINRDWADIAHLPLSHDERVALRAHIEQCVEDLKELNDRLDAMVERPT